MLAALLLILGLVLILMEALVVPRRWARLQWGWLGLFLILLCMAWPTLRLAM